MPRKTLESIRDRVKHHEGPIPKDQVLGLLREALGAAASIANTRDTFTSLALNTERNKMR